MKFITEKIIVYTLFVGIILPVLSVIVRAIRKGISIKEALYSLTLADLLTFMCIGYLGILGGELIFPTCYQ